MKIRLIAIGDKMPSWVDQGCNEFIKRMPPECRVEIHAIPAGNRGKNADIRRITEQEGERMLKAIPGNSLVIALDVLGKGWSTEQLARRMGEWMQDGRDIALLIGGPEGLATACLQRADLRWSLSDLTFPHPLVRIILAEQLYRAWSVLKNHPYHRA